jgi:hypothetical protein
VVQAGAFSSPEKAKTMAETLRSQGFPVFVTSDPGPNGLIRVLIGPVHSAADAEVFRKRLADEGYQALVKRQPVNELASVQESTEPEQTRAPMTAPVPVVETPVSEPGTLR